MLRALVLAVSAAVPFVWHAPPAAPLRVPGGVAGISMEDGNLVVAGGTNLTVFTLRLGAGVGYTRKVCPLGFARDGRTSVVLSGGRLAWLCRGHPGPSRVQLETAPVTEPKVEPLLVDQAQGVSHPWNVTTPWITSLVGSEGQIAYAHGDPLSHPEILASQGVQIGGADGTWPVAAGASHLALTDGTALVVRTGDAVTPLSVHGAPLAGAFDGDLLAVLVPDALELRNVATGWGATLPIIGPRVVAASHGLVVVGAGSDVIAVDEATTEAWLVASSSLPVTAVAVGPYGVAWASQKPSGHQVGYVSEVPLRIVKAARTRFFPR